MSINVQPISITLNDTERYVYRNVNNEPVDYEDFIDDMVAESTVTRHDVKAVVSALEEQLIKYLKSGMTIKFGDLGTFSLTLRGKGQESADDVDSSCITSIGIRFTPSSYIKNEFVVGTDAQSVKFVSLATD